MKKLIIAEKPSVAKDLARVIGGISMNSDRYEADEVIIDSALGHLVELYMPDDFDKKLKKWRLTNLPILPDEFKLKPIAGNWPDVRNGVAPRQSVSRDFLFDAHAMPGSIRVP